jgi:DNA polymerase IV (DinB-like DNA polymerase)
MNLLKDYTPIFQKVSIDEAYLELTEFCQSFKEARKIAKKIQQEIKQKLELSISIGISSTKSVAKIASDFKKPHGITCVPENKIKTFLKNQEITRIPGIGKKTSSVFHKHNIEKIGDLYKYKLFELIDMLGKSGRWVWKVINGLDKRRLNETHKRKSVSKEHTFKNDTNNINLIISKLEGINKKLHRKLKKINKNYRTITLKIRTKDFSTYTRSSSFPYPLQNEELALERVIELFQNFYEKKTKYRLIGIKFSNLMECNSYQTNLLNYV